MRISYDATVSDKTILTTVLLLFVLYPSIVSRVLSLLHCMKIGDAEYLVADLQEPCYRGNHQIMLYSIGLPQLIVYVLGLPVAGIFTVGKYRHQLQHPRIKYRFAMLYLGYCDEKWWWESTVSIISNVSLFLIFNKQHLFISFFY